MSDSDAQAPEVERVFINDVFRLLEREVPADRDVQLLCIGLQLMELLGSDPAAIVSWLSTENPGFGGQRPIDLLSSDEGIAKLNGTLMALGDGSLGY